MQWRPLYLRDAFDGLADKKDYKKVQAAIAELPRLIDQAPAELQEVRPCAVFACRGGRGSGLGLAGVLMC